MSVSSFLLFFFLFSITSLDFPRYPVEVFSFINQITLISFLKNFPYLLHKFLYHLLQDLDLILYSQVQVLPVLNGYSK